MCKLVPLTFLPSYIRAGLEDYFLSQRSYTPVLYCMRERLQHGQARLRPHCSPVRCVPISYAGFHY